MFTAWDDPAAADAVLRDALREAIDSLNQRAVPWASLREEDLRLGIFRALDLRCPGHVRKERLLKISAFRGAGGSDLLVDRVPGERVAWLAETKWSYAQPPKVFEAVWDAIKLCLQIREHGVTRGWLIVGASDAAWCVAEGAELFTGGTNTDTLTLWRQSLTPPKSPNHGKTIGEDLVIGGNGNQPTTVPRSMRTEIVDTVALPGDDPWTVRAIAVAPAEEWVADFAPAPKFPSPLTGAWLAANVPGMDDALFEEFRAYLRVKRWTASEIEHRIVPLRRGDNASS